MHYKNTIEAVYIQLNEIQQTIARLGDDEEIRNIDLDLTLTKLRDVYDLLLSLKAEKQQAEAIDEPKKPEILDFEIEEKPEEKTLLSKEHQIREPKIESKKTTGTANKFLGESFAEGKPTLNEDLSQQVTSSDLANRLKNKPITNLSSAIGLNEKFELISTLFNGDNEKYDHTIEVLNMAANFNEAYNYLSTTFRWDMNDPLVQRILELIRRKLIINKNE